MQSSVENDLAEAKRRWTEKNVKLSKLFVSQSRPCLGISSLCAVIVTSTYRASVEQPAESSHPKPLPHAER